MVYDIPARSFGVSVGDETAATLEDKDHDISSKPTKEDDENYEQFSAEVELIPVSRTEDWDDITSNETKDEEDKNEVKNLSSAAGDTTPESRTEEDEGGESRRQDENADSSRKSPKPKPNEQASAAILEPRTQDQDVDSSRKQSKPKQEDKFPILSSSAPSSPILPSRTKDKQEEAVDNISSSNKPSSKQTVVEKVLECEYDEGANVLYNSIQEKRYHDAYKILTTDETANKSFFDVLFEDLGFAQKEKKLSRRVILSSTWVIRKNNDGSIRWRQLSLHAAVLFDAPYKILQQLVEVYPQALTLADDQGNLPLHLSFRVGLCEEKINILLKAHPDGVLAKNDKGKTPIDVGAEFANSHPIVGCMTKAIKAEKAKAQREMNLMQIQLREERDAEITKLKEERDEEIGNIRQNCQDQILKLRDDFTSAVVKMKNSSANDDKQQQSTAAPSSSGKHPSSIATKQTPPRDPPPMME